MLNPDRKYFESLSEKTNFQIDILEKVNRLAVLLGMIYENDFLKNGLVLKGGTAINFIYFKMPRLSVDIDFNFTSDDSKEGMLESRKEIDRIIMKIFSITGYEVEKVQPYALLQYNLKYRNTAGNIDRIKVEINFIERIPVFEIVEREISVFDNQLKVRTYVIEELFATKLRALLTRMASRDLFDVYNLLNSGLEYDERMLKKCFIFYFCLADDFRIINAKAISEIDPNEIKKFLLPLLEKGRRVKLDTVVGTVQELTLRMLSLNKNERIFIDQFYGQKIANLDILFEDLKYNSKLKNHPMIKWRLKNM